MIAAAEELPRFAAGAFGGSVAPAAGVLAELPEGLALRAGEVCDSSSMSY